MADIELLRTQRDLLVALSGSDDLQECLALCLDAALDSTLFDCGGIYLFDDRDGSLVLQCTRGLSDDFLAQVSPLAPEDPRVRMVLAGQPLYGLFDEMGFTRIRAVSKEGLGFTGIIPLEGDGRIVGSFNVSSRHRDSAGRSEIIALESIASLIGRVVLRVRNLERIRRQEASLHIYRNIVRTVSEAGMEAVLFVSPEGVIQECNTAFAARLGREPEEVAGRCMHQLLPDMPPARLEIMEECLRTRKSVRFEDERSGRFYDNTFYPVLDSDGGVDRVVVVSRDITEQKAMARQLEEGRKLLESKVESRTLAIRKKNEELEAEIVRRRRSEEELRLKNQAVEHSTSGIAFLSLTGRVTYVNRSIVRMWGYGEAEELIGTYGPDHWEDRDEAAKILEVLRAAGTWQGEMLARRRDGSCFWVQHQANYIYDEGGGPSFICSSMIDVDERKRYEALLNETDKLRALGEMAGSIAHEINNPLAGIKNSFLLVKDAVPPDYAYYKYVGSIEKEIDRIARLVNTMLEIYRPDVEVSRRVDLDRLLEDVILFLGPKANAGDVELVREELPAADPIAAFPEGAVKQILLNLVANAIEASPEGSRVLVKASLAERELVLQVEDSGKGIAADEAGSIFQPFYSTKSPQAKATGIGLAITRNIVDRLQGRISFRSRAGEGTLFRVSIPLAGDGCRRASGGGDRKE